MVMDTVLCVHSVCDGLCRDGAVRGCVSGEGVCEGDTSTVQGMFLCVCDSPCAACVFVPQGVCRGIISVCDTVSVGVCVCSSVCVCEAVCSRVCVRLWLCGCVFMRLFMAGVCV